MNFDAQFEDGVDYETFLARYATDEQRRRWQGVFGQVALSHEQRSLLASFRREMKVLVLAGAWCGDCVNQCPIFAHIAAQNERIRIRYFDRDDRPELAAELAICGAPRVPSVLFLSEDGFPCGRSGDRTLAAYRDIASRQLGPSCPIGLLPPENSLLENVVQDWIDEFERIQLMLRTSSRLRQRHGD